MLVSVDIKKLVNHISILEEEKKETDALIECLQSWRNEAMLTGTMELSFFDKQISIVRKQREKIYRRIELVNYMANKFGALVSETSDDLSEISKILQEY